MPLQVSNEFPTLDGLDYKVAIIGDVPSNDDIQLNRPFGGPPGGLLSNLLSNASIIRSACYIGNVSQTQIAYTPKALPVNSWQVTEGSKVLREDLAKFKPNIVVLLGLLPLQIAGVRGVTVENQRGTLFECRDTSSPFYNMKCLATYHPREVFKQYKVLPLVGADFVRVAEEARFPELVLPVRHFDLYLTGRDICRKLDEWPLGHPASIDIEGGIEQCITCMAVADSPHYAFIIDWKNMRDEDKPMVAKSVNRWLRNPEIPKIAQNMLYESMCLAWSHKMPIAGMYWDTMLSGWEINPELSKGLGTQASIYTKEPFYKNERTVLDDHTHNSYCCKDATVTYEIANYHKEYFSTRPQARKHFEFNMALLPAITYMQIRGLRYDSAASDATKAEVDVEMHELQTKVELYNGGQYLNLSSPKQMQQFLYKTLRLQPQFKKEGGRKTNKLTTDTDALLNLMKLHNSDCVYYILKWKKLEEDRKKLCCKIDSDGRIRTSYNIVGTETGRLATYTSNTGSGYSLNTVQSNLRTNFIADEGKWLAQIDLSGADGWTVAAHSAFLGDTTMLEDYYAGVKPALVICAMYELGAHIGILSQSEMLDVLSTYTPAKWLYNAAKAVQHGSNYGMKGGTMSANILKQSWKRSGDPVHMTPRDCEALQSLYFTRYPGVLRWHSWVKMQLHNRGYLECCSGHTRTFFGRKQDDATFRSALAHEPQANTTYATNLALKNLWLDESNRLTPGTFHIEPVHHMHDALLVQFLQSRTVESIPMIQGYFDNEFTIAKQTIKIPYEGEYGLYWGDSSGGKICNKTQ